MKISRSLLSLNSLRFLFFHNADKWPKNIYEGIKAGCSVMPNFITEAEEQQLLNEIEPYLKRLKYEESHWDDAIRIYRERKLSKWSPKNEAIIKRLLNTFPSDNPASSSVHILDLHKDGAILPHVDSVKYCGEIVSGLSLLSDCVMRLRHVEKKDELFVDLHLPRLSLYKLRNLGKFLLTFPPHISVETSTNEKLNGVGRYEFMHEVLHEDESYHGMDKGRIVKDRRISLICRDEPKGEQIAENKVEFKAIPAHE
ncbi:hypothetical protein DdX_05495 [Ditylenchus destructor]|uniref:Uncharacterized protein n=1 Tax=Ditylenchus destructor TaxID=166010 RepID=A0AAD4N7D1_9BILA|nr:hypothetical protein DdX_05495 [Ditylenchus destructor]